MCPIRMPTKGWLNMDKELPVKLNGVVIGKATLLDNGYMSISFDPDFQNLISSPMDPLSVYIDDTKDALDVT